MVSKRQVNEISGRIIQGLKASGLDEGLNELSKEVIQQYEECRTLGSCNMFDRNCVARFAFDNGMHDLSAVASDSRLYGMLLKNYSTLMRHYGIQSGYRSGLRRKTKLVSRFQ